MLFATRVLGAKRLMTRPQTTQGLGYVMLSDSGQHPHKNPTSTVYMKDKHGPVPGSFAGINTSHKPFANPNSEF